jgi:hypothetical protein
MFLNKYKSCVTGIFANLDEDILCMLIFVDYALKKLIKSMFSLQENICVNVSWYRKHSATFVPNIISAVFVVVV